MSESPNRSGLRLAGEIQPAWTSDRVPLCDEECPSHDGKRCMVLGLRPGYLCEPAVAAMAARIAELQQALRKYGRHSSFDCHLWVGEHWDSDGTHHARCQKPCVCGLDSAVAGEVPR